MNIAIYGAKIRQQLVFMAMLVFAPVVFSEQKAPQYALLINLSPAVCSIDPSKQRLRQCQEGFRMTVSSLQVIKKAKVDNTKRDCSADPAELSPLQNSVVDRVMPDRHLRQQDWQKNGACSGMSPSQYFRTIATLSGRIKTPESFSRAQETVYNQQQLIEELVSLNPGLQSESVRLRCAHSNQYQFPVLTEIRVCYDPETNYGVCPNNIISHCAAQVSVIGSP